MLTFALERVEFLPLGRVTDDTSILTIRSLVFEPLCRWCDGVVGPGLLAAWSHDEKGLAWRFELRPNAKFHDGSRCTAEDVVNAIGGFLRGVDMFGMPWAYARYLAGAVIEAAGAGTLCITTPEPLADLPEILAEFFVIRSRADGEPLIGTGPYQVVDYVPNRSATLAAMNKARGPDSIRLLAQPDADERFRMVDQGAANAATNLERMTNPNALGHANLIRGQAANTLSVMYYLDCARGAFASAEMRRAANLAVDAQAIVDELFAGLGILASTVVSPFHLGHREAALAPIPHDPVAARAAFAKAGPQSELLIRTPLHMPEKAVEISRMVARHFEIAGLPARMEMEADRPEYARQVGRGQIGDMAIFDSSPHSTFRVLNDKISSTTRGQWWQGHEDPVLEPMIAQAACTMDDAARATAYGRCLRRLQKNPPWLYLFHPIEVFAAREGTPPLRLDHRGVLSLAV